MHQAQTQYQSSIGSSEKSDTYEQTLSYYVTAYLCVLILVGRLPKNDVQILAPLRRWEKRVGFFTSLNWDSIYTITLIHLSALLWPAVYLHYGVMPKWQTVVFTYVMSQVGLFGVVGGAHRYWTHRSFKATWPLRVILLVCFACSGQNTLKEWVKEHRVHHKCVDTDADPYSSQRGFFFSHVGCYMMRRHRAYYEELAKIDLSDVLEDPLVKFQEKYLAFCNVSCCFALPTLASIILWNESCGHAILTQVFLKYVFMLNCTWSVNSIGHNWGSRPYDASILPAENQLVAVLCAGEGWHNYHHTFPWDYKGGELPYRLNPTTLVLDLFAKIGWAYDLRAASPQLIMKTALKTGPKNITFKSVG